MKAFVIAKIVGVLILLTLAAIWMAFNIAKSHLEE
jgi:hypothetical protein